jgi:hypothetical protein
MESIAVQIAAEHTRRLARSALPDAALVGDERHPRRVQDALLGGLSEVLRMTARWQVHLAARLDPRPLH